MWQTFVPSVVCWHLVSVRLDPVFCDLAPETTLRQEIHRPFEPHSFEQKSSAKLLVRFHFPARRDIPQRLAEARLAKGEDAVAG
jgi:hypothetical protein